MGYIYKTENVRYDKETGEVIESKITKLTKLTKEPDYIKLYINAVLAICDLSQSINPVLFELLKHMTYANDCDGGQIIYLNSALRKKICETIGISSNRLSHILTKVVKSNILKRIDRGTFAVNPDMFGKGEWKDILKVKEIYINFERRTIKPNYKNKEGNNEQRIKGTI